MAETDINIGVFVDESHDGDTSVDDFGEVSDVGVFLETVVQTLEEVGFALDEIGAHADDIDIAGV